MATEPDNIIIGSTILPEGTPAWAIDKENQFEEWK